MGQNFLDIQYFEALIKSETQSKQGKILENLKFGRFRGNKSDSIPVNTLDLKNERFFPVQEIKKYMIIILSIFLC